MIPDHIDLGRPRESLLWEQVSAGDRLPGFELPITMKTIVLAVTGTRDYMPYHHNEEFCRGVGIRGIFVNTTFNQALVGRCVTDWSGPEADLRSVSLQMVDQLCLGDVAHVDGHVARTWSDGDDRLAEIVVEVRNHRGVTSRAPVVLALPHQDGPVVQRILDGEPEKVELDPGLPPQLQTRLNERVSRHGLVPVSEAQILSWCEMVRDRNPLYFDTPSTRAGRFGGVVAPAMALSIWNLGTGSQTGIDAKYPDVDAPYLEAWPGPLEGDWPFEWRAPGATEVIVQRRHAEFGLPVRPGDQIHSTARLLNCSGRKETKLGPGYFLTRFEVYRNQRNEVIGHTLMSLLQYGSEVADAARAAEKTV